MNTNRVSGRELIIVDSEEEFQSQRSHIMGMFAKEYTGVNHHKMTFSQSFGGQSSNKPPSMKEVMETKEKSN